MNITEQMKKSQERKAKIKEITLLPGSKECFKFYFIIIAYWVMTFIFHDIYNNYRYRQYQKDFYEQILVSSSIYDFQYKLYKPSNLIFIMAIILAVLLFIFNKKIRKTCLFLLADIALFIYSIWIPVKFVLLCICKTFCGIFKLSEKIEAKYNNMNDKQKFVVKRVLAAAAGFAVSYAVNEIMSTAPGAVNDSTFVNPHEVSGYTRKDGTKVDSYYRDGDNNPLTRLTKEDGGGYFRKK